MNRYPYHRYLRYLVIDGERTDEIQSHLSDLDYAPPTTEDVDFLRRTLVTGRIVDDAWRERCEVDMFEESSDDMTMAHKIVETGVMRGVCERALLDRVPVRHVSTILTLKFGLRVTERAVSLFRRGWWDTETLSIIDFANYYRAKGDRKPDPPAGVPVHMRGAAAAWEHGILPAEDELSTEDIVRALQVDAFMHYERARMVPSPAMQNEARKWAALALKTSQIRAPKTVKTDQPSLPGLKAQVYYPEQHAPSLADLEQPGDTDDDDPI